MKRGIYMETALFFLSILVFALGVLILYQFIKPFIFDKLRVNKWIILIIALIEFLVPSLIWPTMPKVFVNYIIPGIFVLLFLWFMDLSGFIKKAKPISTTYDKRSKKNNIIIKPKAKPNRVKK
jgi:hypothetical protein